MKVKEFRYKKDDGFEDRKLFVLYEDKEYLKGIDLNKLSDSESKILEALQQEYEEKLKPFYKAYRQFKKEKMEENIINE